MSLTICMVVYNEEKNLSLIRKNLQLFFEQAPSISLLLVDNASTDKTSSFLYKMKDQFGAHILQRTQNHLPQARDEALRFCQTEWLAFIDADCLADSQWLQCVHSLCASKGARFAAYGGPWQIQGPSASIYQSLFRTFLGNFGQPYLKKWPAQTVVDHLPTANILYHRSSVLQVGGFRSTNWRVGEDLDLSFRLRHAGFRILYVPQMVVSHHLPVSLSTWAHKMFHYGTARGELTVNYKKFLSYQYLLPMVFSGFILLSLVAGSPFLGSMLMMYLGVCAVVSLFSAAVYLQAQVFLWMVTTHFFYASGVLCGFLKALLWRGHLEPKLSPQGRKVPAVGRP